MAREDPWVAEADRHHWGQRSPAHRVAAISGTLPSGASVLEVGCGPGAALSHALTARGYRVIASDANAAFMVASRAAAGERNLPLIRANGVRLPFREGAFDAVCAFDIAEHIVADAAAVREWARVAARCVVLSVPSSEDAGMSEVGLSFAHWLDRTHRRAYTRGEVATLLEEAGLARLEVTAEFPLHPADAYLHVLRMSSPPAGLVPRLRKGVARTGARVLRHVVDPHTVVPQSWLAVGWKPAAAAMAR